MRTFRRLLCRVGVHHWRVEVDPESGLPFHACERCGRVKDTVALVDSPFM